MCVCVCVCVCALAPTHSPLLAVGQRQTSDNFTDAFLFNQNLIDLDILYIFGKHSTPQPLYNTMTGSKAKAVLARHPCCVQTKYIDYIEK